MRFILGRFAYCFVRPTNEVHWHIGEDVCQRDLAPLPFSPFDGADSVIVPACPHFLASIEGRILALHGSLECDSIRYDFLDAAAAFRGAAAVFVFAPADAALGQPRPNKAW